MVRRANGNQRDKCTPKEEADSSESRDDRRADFAGREDRQSSRDLISQQTKMSLKEKGSNFQKRTRGAKFDFLLYAGQYLNSLITSFGKLFQPQQLKTTPWRQLVRGNNPAQPMMN